MKYTRDQLCTNYFCSSPADRALCEERLLTSMCARPFKMEERRRCCQTLLNFHNPSQNRPLHLTLPNAGFPFSYCLSTLERSIFRDVVHPPCAKALTWISHLLNRAFQTFITPTAPLHSRTPPLYTPSILSAQHQPLLSHTHQQPNFTKNARIVSGWQPLKDGNVHDLPCHAGKKREKRRMHRRKGRTVEDTGVASS